MIGGERVRRGELVAGRYRLRARFSREREGGGRAGGGNFSDAAPTTTTTVVDSGDERERVGVGSTRRRQGGGREERAAFVRRRERFFGVSWTFSRSRGLTYTVMQSFRCGAWTMFMEFKVWAEFLFHLFTNKRLFLFQGVMLEVEW